MLIEVYENRMYTVMKIIVLVLFVLGITTGCTKQTSPADKEKASYFMYGAPILYGNNQPSALKSDKISLFKLIGDHALIWRNQPEGHSAGSDPDFAAVKTTKTAN